MIAAKLLIHTGCILLPIVILCPIEGLLFSNGITETKVLAISLFLGAPALFALTALAAAFNVGRVQRTTLMALIVLPLTVPVMIFGSAVMNLYQIQGAVMGLYALLAAISLLCLAGLPFAIAAVLRLRFED
jgi:heme exporter protein B